MLLVFGVVGGPVVAAEERLVVLSAAETAKHVEIGEPAAKKIGDAILAADRAGPTTSKEHSTSYVQVVLPSYGDFESVGGNDFEGGKHNRGG